MGKLNLFEITFANDPGVFYAGTLLKGHVTVDLNEPMSMRGIRLNIEGEAHVRWPHKRRSFENSDSSDHHMVEGRELYFDKDILLHGILPSEGSATTELSDGKHRFPFELPLPADLPSSFEGEYGHVRYVASCFIDKPWKFDHKTKRSFTVISILDLNQQPKCSNQLEASRETHLCCLCCKSGTIWATLHLQRQGYVPGEVVKLSAEIRSHANRSISKSDIQLIMVVTYRAVDHRNFKKVVSKVVPTVVASVTHPGIAGQSMDVWSGEEMVIPPLPPSFLGGCGIIDIHYMMQLNVDPKGAAINLKVPLEIVIGNIPLKSVLDRDLPRSPVSFKDRSNWPTLPSNSPGKASPFSGIPPPSYKESITGPVNTRGIDDLYTHGETNFAPTYTYYDWGRSPVALAIK